MNKKNKLNGNAEDNAEVKTFASLTNPTDQDSIEQQNKEINLSLEMLETAGSDDTKELFRWREERRRSVTQLEAKARELLVRAGEVMREMNEDPGNIVLVGEYQNLIGKSHALLWALGNDYIDIDK